MLSREDLRQRAQEVFRDVLEDSELNLLDDLAASDHPSWDSLNHLTLVISLEKEFSVSFSTSEVMRWKNVGDILDSLMTKHE